MALTKYDQQRLNESVHNKPDITQQVRDQFNNWEDLVKEIKSKNKSIKEKDIIKVILALAESETSNIQTAIMSVCRYYERKMSFTDALEKSVENILLVSEFTATLEVSGYSYHKRVTARLHNSIGFLNILIDKAVKLPMIVRPRKVVDNFNSGWIYVPQPVLIGKAKKHNKELAYDVLNIMNSIPLKMRKNKVCEELLKEIAVDPKNKQGFKKDYRTIKNEKAARKIELNKIKDFIKFVGEDEFYHTYGYDGRGRLYVLSSVLNYQQKAKHLIKLANEEIINEDGFDNLKIDLANQYGEATNEDLVALKDYYSKHSDLYPSINGIDNVQMLGDKSTWEERLLFGDCFFGSQFSNVSVSKEPNQTDEPELYLNSLECLQDYFKGNPTGHLIGLDATNSCGQIISLSMGDMVGMLNCNVISPKDIDQRMDFYQIMSDVCPNDIDRKSMKKAVMPSLYNSSAKPAEVFPNPDDLELFYKARLEALPSCEKFLNICNYKLWNKDASEHSWYMPDGHYVSVRSYNNDGAFTIALEEDIAVQIKCKVYEPSEYFTPLAAK